MRGKGGFQFVLSEMKISCSSPGVCPGNDSAEIERCALLEEREVSLIWQRCKKGQSS